MHFQRVNFAILYVGGDDLANVNAEPQGICDNIGKLVLQLQHDVAPIVYVFKVLSRCFHPEDADAERNKKKARLLNRKLTATLERWPSVRILNAEHRFLDYSKEPRRALFTFDGYNVDRARGINQLAKIIVAFLV
ncbi:hypothetical protein MRX96_000077 [Rhipicephalus microplus]